ncbi:Cyclophilin type peptidyl-prolyl cis-trans isomerase/CLD [Carpediemonas membranifera]|uniref:peptidylprolyl isomerase n=1 Tax=Carpediemonas membranifera TaxID=201153 RepID=A0A8J6BC27_9EUKA|nr:Cyclophilin type peptidyl-prolyl cis-trans isomerase/CLD [Carpediemonas membranifera]|eukprot:KAG9397127.1 Cyclophilin type peptidyl-prolyl cis-trans isomerase/CLD [Carpediemonas membranifera]
MADSLVGKRKNPGHNSQTGGLWSLFPREDMYRVAYLHGSPILHLLAVEDCVLTTDATGVVRVWRRLENSLEEEKTLNAHHDEVLSLVTDGVFIASVGADRVVNIYDRTTRDIVIRAELPFRPSLCSLIQGDLVVADRDDFSLHWFAVAKGLVEKCVITGHQARVVGVIPLGRGDVLSGDCMGRFFITPHPRVSGTMEAPFMLLKGSSSDPPKPVTIVSNSTATAFVVCGTDRVTRVFQSSSRRRLFQVNDTLSKWQQVPESSTINLRENVIFKQSATRQYIQPCFDPSGRFLAVPLANNISIYHVEKKARINRLAETESARFIALAILPVPDRGGVGTEDYQPLLLAIEHQSPRLCVFCDDPPADPTMRDTGVGAAKPKDAVPESTAGCAKAVISTTMGDIWVDLFPQKCPKTVDNFARLARSGYYNGNIFHRVIRDFMIQSGDPTGTGTGGVSADGVPFADEFDSELTHNKPFVLSMANRGPDTNTSQWFVTVASCPWLNWKHTVFGAVSQESSKNVARQLSCVETDRSTDKPVKEVRVVSVTVM